MPIGTRTAAAAMLRASNRSIQALKLEFAEFEQITIRTPLVQTEEEAEALRAALIAHSRDPDRGRDQFRFREREQWRHVRAVIERAAAQNGANE